jgi:large subunit ribosomal protein L25
MKSVELEAIARDGAGKKGALNTLRKEGRVPGIIYGGENNINLHVDAIRFSKLIHTSDVYLLNLKFEDKTIRTVIKDVQFHPVTDAVIHIDFMEVFDDKPISIGVPVVFTGKSIGVLNGGKRREKLRKLVLKAVHKDIPDEVSIDITNLRIGQSIKVGDVKLENVEILDHPNAVIIAVKTSRVAVDDALDAEEEAAEGAEGEGATEGAEAEAATE